MLSHRIYTTWYEEGQLVKRGKKSSLIRSAVWSSKCRRVRVYHKSTFVFTCTKRDLNLPSTGGHACALAVILPSYVKKKLYLRHMFHYLGYVGRIVILDNALKAARPDQSPRRVIISFLKISHQVEKKSASSNLGFELLMSSANAASGFHH
jgi:hypothetical protein